tara:strand:- start:2055 stop:4010 length:1956 start_codon:yes stop_codon:yes gene_type:complete
MQLSAAAAAGDAKQCAVLLGAGANPAARGADGSNSAGVAARHGHCAVLGVLLRHEPTLVALTDEQGRTPLHWAVAAAAPRRVKVTVPDDWVDGMALRVATPDGQLELAVPAGLAAGDTFETSTSAASPPPVELSTAQLVLHGGAAQRQHAATKFLLGRWGADVHAADAHGDTPLHLCTTRPVLLLLHHAPARRPSLSTQNTIGRSPPQQWEAAGSPELAMAARERGSWLHKPSTHELARAVSFIPTSASRTPPASMPPRSWPRRLDCVHAGIVLMPFTWLAIAACVPAAAAPWLLCAPLLCCVVRPSEWGQFFSLPSSLPIAALLLLTPIVQIALTFHALLLWPALSEGRVGLLALTLACEAAVVRSYGLLLTRDAGFVRGGTADAARRYWESLEKPTGDVFDHRAEAIRPRRAHFSPMSGSLVRGMDHDCPWIGGAVGQGNHRPFVGLLASGIGALLGHVALCCVVTRPTGIANPHWHQPGARLWWLVLTWIDFCRFITLQSPWIRTQEMEGGGNEASRGGDGGPARSWLDLSPSEMAIARLLVLSELLALLLVVLTSLLLLTQLQLICVNVLTVEEISWRRLHPSERAPPKRRQPGWDEYAPYDHGSSWRNLLAFMRAERGGLEPEAPRTGSLCPGGGRAEDERGDKAV